jgi:hypothetical protein
MCNQCYGFQRNKIHGLRTSRIRLIYKDLISEEMKEMSDDVKVNLTRHSIKLQFRFRSNLLYRSLTLGIQEGERVKKI